MTNVHRLARLGVQIEDSLICGVVARHNSELSLVIEIKSKQLLNQELMELKESVFGKLNESFYIEGLAT